VSFCKSPAKEIPRDQQCQEGIGCQQMTCERLFHSEHFLISRLLWGQNWQICLNIHVERKQTPNLPGLMLPLTSLRMLRVVLLDEGRGRILSMAYRRQKPKVKKSRAFFLLQETNKNTHPAQIGQEDNNNTGCSRVCTSATPSTKLGRLGNPLLPIETFASMFKCSNRTSILGSSIPTLASHFSHFVSFCLAQLHCDGQSKKVLHMCSIDFLCGLDCNKNCCCFEILCCNLLLLFQCTSL
jgi:hypothetical protein